MARYTISGDRLHVDDFLACFTPDAVIESEHVPSERAFRYEGHLAIRGWQERWRSGEATTHGATFVRHHLSTSRIDLTNDDTAQARTYWTAWTDIGPDHAGLYLDRFRKIEGDWRIAHRRVRMDWEAPNSLFRQAVANSRE
jgi:hypothetical protein